MISVTLSNRDCIFDSGKFENIQDAIAFSKFRGGIYTVQIGRGDDIGISLSYNSENDTFSRYNGWDWEDIDETEIRI